MQSNADSKSRFAIEYRVVSFDSLINSMEFVSADNINPRKHATQPINRCYCFLIFHLACTFVRKLALPHTLIDRRQHSTPASRRNFNRTKILKTKIGILDYILAHV